VDYCTSPSSALKTKKQVIEKWDKCNFFSSTSFWASEGRVEEYLGHPRFLLTSLSNSSVKPNATHAVWQQPSITIGNTLYFVIIA